MWRGENVYGVVVTLFGAVLGWFGDRVAVFFALRSPAAVLWAQCRCPRTIVPSLLKRGCRDCGATWGLFSMAPLTATLAAAFAYASPQHAPWLTFVVTILLLGALCDAFTTYIPDETTLPLIFAGVAYAAFYGVPAGDVWLFDRLCGRWGGVAAAVVGAAVGAAVPFLVRIIGTALLKKEAMGLGDSLLLAAIGAALGPKQVLVAFLLASVLGTVHNIPRLLRQRLAEVAFGPYLLAAAIIMLLTGRQICYILFVAYPRWLAGA